jgi:hypothetical protein
MADGLPTGVADGGAPPTHDDSQQPVAGHPEITLKDILRPELKPLTGRLVKERARTLLAGTFALAFLLTLCASFVGSLTKWGPVKDWLQVVLPAETALFGSALGFYFGSNTDAD